MRILSAGSSTKKVYKVIELSPIQLFLRVRNIFLLTSQRLSCWFEYVLPVLFGDWILLPGVYLYPALSS